MFVLDISSASLHTPLAPPMSYSNHCCSNQFCVGSDQLHAVAIWGSCSTSVPVSFHPRLLCWYRGRYPKNIFGIHACTTLKGRGVMICGEKLGPMVAGSQWVKDSLFPSLDRSFCTLFHTASQAFHGIQQPVTIAGACSTTHYLCTGSSSFPAFHCVASIPGLELPLTSKTRAFQLLSQALLSGHPG